MLFDHDLVFSDGQVLSASAKSTNKLDFGAAKRIGNGNTVCLWLKIYTETGTSPTIDVIFRGDTNEAAGSEVELAYIRRAKALDNDPDIHLFALPVVPPYEFYDLYFNLPGTTPGYLVFAGLVVDPQTTPMIPIQDWI